VLCVDLGSASGVQLAGGPVLAGWVEARRGVRVGNHLLTLDDGSDRPARLAPGGGVGLGHWDLDGPVLAGPVPRVVLEFRANRFQTDWSMKRPIALAGSAPECRVRLNGPGVSPFHCALVRTSTGLWAVDLLGTIDPKGHGGILLNGEPVRSGLLGPGDHLRVGEFLVTARYGSMFQSRTPQFGNPPPDLTLADAGASSDPNRPGFPADPADRPSASPADDLREELLARLDQVVLRQSNEIEALRREVEDLRDLAEDLRARLRASRRSHTGPARNGNSPNGKARTSPPAGRGNSVRVLGSAVQPGDTAPSTLGVNRTAPAAFDTGFALARNLNGVGDVPGEGLEHPNLSTSAPTPNPVVN
jgi:hypothetical protein